MNFKDFLPSKYIIAFVLIPVLSIIIFFILKETVLKNNEGEKKEALETFVKTLNNEIKYKDTDGDGLKDWEERLHKTDKNKPDTDGDGISDGLEIKAGTDPLDVFNKIKKTDVEKIENDYDYKEDPKLSKMDVLARDFLIKAINLKESNLVKNKNAQEQVIEELLKENSFVFKDKFIKNDLVIANVPNSYIKEKMREGFLKYRINKLRNNYLLFAMYVDTEEGKYLDELIDNTNLINDFIKYISKIKVNEELSMLYLRYLNNLYKFNQASTMLSLVDTDPMSSWIAFDQYSKLENAVDKDISAMALYFK